MLSYTGKESAQYGARKFPLQLWLSRWVQAKAQQYGCNPDSMMTNSAEFRTESIKINFEWNSRTQIKEKRTKALGDNRNENDWKCMFQK